MANRRVATLLVLAAAALPFGGMSVRAEEPAARCGIEALGWIAGSWEMETDGGRTEEHWTQPAGGTMLGVGRTVKQGRTLFFEFLRLEEREDGVYYVALIQGQPEVGFKLVRCEGEDAVFENLEHDYPQRILYRKNADGSLTARIEGPRDGKIVGEDFTYKPSNKD